MVRKDKDPMKKQPSTIVQWRLQVEFMGILYLLRQS